MQELGKFDLKINVIPTGFEKYLSFTINTKLRFIDSFYIAKPTINNRKQESKHYNILRSE